MKKSWQAEEPIMVIPKQHEAGVKTANLCQKREINDATVSSR